MTAIHQENFVRFQPITTSYNQRSAPKKKKALLMNCCGNTYSSSLDLNKRIFLQQSGFHAQEPCVSSCFLTGPEFIWKTLPVLAKEHSQHIIDFVNNSYIHSFNKHLQSSQHIEQHTGDLLSTRQESPRLATFCLMGLLGTKQESEQITEPSVCDVAKLGNLIYAFSNPTHFLNRWFFFSQLNYIYLPNYILTLCYQELHQNFFKWLSP